MCDNRTMAEKFETLTSTLQQKFPNTKIYMSGIIHKRNSFKDKINVVNRNLEKICQSANITFVNNDNVATFGNGQINNSVFHDDTHLNDIKGVKRFVMSIKYAIGLRTNPLTALPQDIITDNKDIHVRRNYTPPPAGRRNSWNPQPYFQEAKPRKHYIYNEPRYMDQRQQSLGCHDHAFNPCDEHMHSRWWGPPIREMRYFDYNHGH